LDPSEDGDVVGLDATLEEEFLDVAVGQVVPQVQPDRDHDDVRREPEPGERRPWWLDWTPAVRVLHRSSLPDQSIDQCNGPRGATAARPALTSVGATRTLCLPKPIRAGQRVAHKVRFRQSGATVSAVQELARRASVWCVDRCAGLEPLDIAGSAFMALPAVSSL
jgi:hypothetical protein